MTLISCNSLTKKEGPEAGKPNIIFIYADDLGSGLIGVNGQKIIKTPSIDKLSRQGISFDHNYGCAFCLPARASLLTGLHDAHKNAWNHVNGGAWIDYRKGKHSFKKTMERVDSLHLPIPQDEVFLPQLLKKAGYFTAQVGKLEWGFSTTPNRLERHGWDHHFGYYDHKNGHGYYPKSLFRNGKEVFFTGNTSNNSKTPGPSYSQNLFLDEILELIRNHQVDKPFFIYHPTQIPHGDIMIPEINSEFIDDERLTKNQKKYASMVKMLDDHIGIIMDELVVQGIDNNTIVIFSVDNGHEVYYEPDHRLSYDEGKGLLSDKYDSEDDRDVFNGNNNLSGKKFSTWEGGIRVPLIVSWPGKIRPDSKSDLLVANYDLMPTLADISGIEMPEGKDGVSYLPTLLDKPEQVEHDFVIARGAVRYTAHRGAALVSRDGWKVRYFENEEVYMLYDLNSDPKEDYDLSLEYPKKLAELRKMFDKEFNSQRRDINSDFLSQ
ncbi:MAG: sulfatase-like hydrolase/transferase [Cyclobacteriaceae bacterium]